MKSTKNALTVGLFIIMVAAFIPHASEERTSAQSRLVYPVISGLTTYERKYVKFDLDVERYESKYASEDAASANAGELIKYYNKLFGKLGSSVKIDSLSNRDLEAVFQAFNTILYYNDSERYIEHLRAAATDLYQRGLLHTYQAQALYGALFYARKFHVMEVVFEKYGKRYPLQSPFIWKNNIVGFPKHEIVNVKWQTRTLNSNIVNLTYGTHVVVIAEPMCHFAVNAVTLINATPKLKSLFSRYAVWVAPVDRTMGVNVFEDWDRMFPDAKMSIAYSESAWPEVSVWESPIFLFFKNGRYITSVTGWRGARTIEALKQTFESLGIHAHG